MKALSPKVVKRIEALVDKLYDSLKARYLGPTATDKRLFIGYIRDFSLPGIYAEAVSTEGGLPDTELLKAIIKVAGGYIDASRERGKARIVKAVTAFLQQQGVTAEEDPSMMFDKLRVELSKQWEKMDHEVRRIIDTEASQARGIGLVSGIVKINEAIGVRDPVVVFLGVLDKVICEECLTLHYMPDRKTPRAWYPSEISHDYHKKGDPTPSIGGLHPHCRCTMSTIAPGWGINAQGRIDWIYEGYSLIDDQRGLTKTLPEILVEPLFKAEGPVSVEYVRRVSATPTPHYGSRFGQDVEPAGEYMTHTEGNTDRTPSHINPKDPSQNTFFEYGTVHFQNPLIMPHNDDLIEWKRSLSRQFGGLTGGALSDAIKAKGHDGILVQGNPKYGSHWGEIVNLGAVKDVMHPFPDEAKPFLHRPTPLEKNLKDTPAFKRAMAIRSRIDELVAAGEGPSAWPSKTGSVVISRDPSKPGRWRATSFVGEEPTGHTEAEDYRSVLRVAHEVGANLLGDPLHKSDRASTNCCSLAESTNQESSCDETCSASNLKTKSRGKRSRRSSIPKLT